MVYTELFAIEVVKIGFVIVDIAATYYLWMKHLCNVLERFRKCWAGLGMFGFLDKGLLRFNSFLKRKFLPRNILLLELLILSL